MSGRQIWNCSLTDNDQQNLDVNFPTLGMLHRDMLHRGMLHRDMLHRGMLHRDMLHRGMLHQDMLHRDIAAMQNSINCILED